MPSQKEITDSLQTAFQPLHLTVTDDSAQHAGHAGAPAGGGSHFSVTIVSERFQGLSNLKRHQMVYKTLGNQFKDGLHALALQTFTPEEHGERRSY